MALMSVPGIFKGMEGVRAGMSLRGTGRGPFGFNLSLSVGDDPKRVMENRARFARRLGFDPARLATQRQVHGATIVRVTNGYAPCESDALTTNEPGWLLGVSVADCVPVLFYDRRTRAIAAVHSGWRGTRFGIAARSLERMGELWGTRAEDLLAYVGAGAAQCCYEVGEDVASEFDARYSRSTGDGRYLFDNKGAVIDQLLASGMNPRSLEVDPLCTICSPAHQSYRRDGKTSGRMLAAIGLTGDVRGSNPLETA